MKKIIRDPKRLIYSSSPDRGLVYLLNMWPEIIKAVPEANLHIYYGFNVFDAIHSHNPGRMKWKEKVLQLMKQEGITYHGRVGHAELHTEMAKSGIWAYPTDFTEISCITAMKCQTLGAIPVCTTVGALKETVRNGIKVDVDITEEEGQAEYQKQLIKLLTDDKLQEEIRQPMMKWAKGYFGWDQVSVEWDKLFRLYVQNPEMQVIEEI